MQTVYGIMPNFYGNQTKAADALCVNRATLKKYLKDRDGKHHRIIEIDGQQRLVSILGGRQ